VDDRERTIQDFGAQFTRHREPVGYRTSVAWLGEVCGPLLSPDELRGRRVMEIGSGNGRLVNVLLDAGVAHVVAVEPSEAFDVLVENTRERAERVTCVRARGDEAPDAEVDDIFSIGVLHHVPDPGPVVRRAFEVLRPGGRFVVWLYAREGNELYLALASPLRRLTRRLPDAVLVALSRALALGLTLYAGLCRFLPLPMRDYMRTVRERYGFEEKTQIVFDQLNPTHARYYRREEALALLGDGGFEDVRAWHHGGRGWTLVGRKPASPRAGYFSST